MITVQLISLILFLWAGVVNGVITGEKQCNKYMCITGRHDNSTQLDIYTLSPPSGSQIPLRQFGWMAIGFGSTMANSPMVIVWPNGDGSLTLSQRQSPSNAAPSVVSKPTRKATLNTTQSYSNSTDTSFTFYLPSTQSNPNMTSLIWAISSRNPGASSSSAGLFQHDQAGSTYLNLAATWSDSATNNNNNNNSGGGGGGTSKALVAHAVCGGLATLLILPIGTLIPRIARGFSLNRWWFPAHGIVNGFIGALLIIIAFAIAQTKLGDGGSHGNIGTAVFVLIIIQVLLGIFVHWYKSHFYSLQTKSGRGPSNFLHMALGVFIVVLGWATSWTGMAQQWPSATGGNINVGVKVVWGLLVAIALILYIGGIVWLMPKQRALEREARLRHEGIDGAQKSNGESRVEMTPSRGFGFRR